MNMIPQGLIAEAEARVRRQVDDDGALIDRLISAISDAETKTREAYSNGYANGQDFARRCAQADAETFAKEYREAKAENERLMLRKLSDVLTGGNAGTWDEIVHAAEHVHDVVNQQAAETERKLKFGQDTLLARGACFCGCCGHGEGSDCACECHAHHAETYRERVRVRWCVFDSIDGAASCGGHLVPLEHSKDGWTCKSGKVTFEFGCAIGLATRSAQLAKAE